MMGVIGRENLEGKKRKKGGGVERVEKKKGKKVCGWRGSIVMVAKGEGFIR